MVAPNPYGNVYDKFGSRHPVEAALMRGYLRALTDLVRQAAPRRVLEVGCGEGELAPRLLGGVLPAGTPYLATDLCGPGLRAARARARKTNAAPPGLRFAAQDATRLGIADRAVDLVLACEVLEHLPAPEPCLAELARVTRGHVLLSVPWEPVWRLGNLARRRYWRDLGNTPGHVQWFTRRRLRRLVRPHLEIVAERHPLPWTFLLARPR